MRTILNSKFNNSVYQDYFKLLILSLILAIGLRLIETSMIFIQHGLTDSLMLSEFKGLVFDILIINSIFLILFPLYFIINRASAKLASILATGIIIIIALAHIIILKYYTYQLSPLDIFLYSYSKSEIISTLKAEGSGYTIFLPVLILILLFIISSYFLNKVKLKVKFIKIGCMIQAVSISLILLQVFTTLVNFNSFTKNKSLYFYNRSLAYFLQKPHIEEYSVIDGENFNRIFLNDSIMNSEYPLMHLAKDSDSLNSFFKRFEQSPNIVILIIEGLGDNFIHEYHGVEFMPFLTNFKQKSLYWKHCFTLGERSFAVVPSILGSLPYGEAGFTIQKKLPKHISLVSLLGANDYFTTFFYGQGAFFHQKDRFFQFNNADLIFDKSKFDEKYNKVIAGQDDFFWGYNDKDLFNQSLAVIDTLPEKRLDIYFTGTSHSPFAITDQALYDDKYFYLTEKAPPEDSIFFVSNKKYLQSLIFVDDALRDYFTGFQKRPEYRNTVFIITGDHPMTEVPRGNSLKRYHVPLLIYSPKLKSPAVFSSIVSHLDVYQSLLSVLSENGLRVPELCFTLSEGLSYASNPDHKTIVFMDDNREIRDIYSDGLYLTGNELFKVGQNLALTTEKNKQLKRKLQLELETFKKLNDYLSREDKIVPDTAYCSNLGYHLLYSQSHDTVQIINSEFYTLADKIVTGKSKKYFDFSFNFEGKNIQKMSLVYQLKTLQDSLVFWKNIGIPEKGDFLQAHLPIPEQISSDISYLFSAYFWNPDLSNLSFQNYQGLLYEKY